MAQGLTERVQDIEWYRWSMDHEAASMDSICIDIPGWSTEGAEAIGYFRSDGELISAYSWSYGESGKWFQSFYFEQGQVVFSNLIDSRYNRPIYWDEDKRRESNDTEVFDQAKTRTASWDYFFEEGVPLCSGPNTGGQNTGDKIAVADTNIRSQAISLRSVLQKARNENAKDCEGLNWRNEIRDLPKRCEMLSPDTSLANVALENSISSIAALGSIPDDVLIEDTNFPHVDFASSDGSQWISFFFYHGGVLDNYAAMRLSRSRPTNVRDTLPHALFRSGMGVALGMSKADVITKLGTCYSIYHGDYSGELLYYAIKDFDHSDFLDRYNMPSYFSLLEFDQDKLIEYRFGFDYP
ncbi:MAG: hypothetical protein ABIY71_13520 [Flavobacteriales bacterium]